MNFIDRQTEPMPDGAAQSYEQPMIEQSVADALAARVAELESEIESMINMSSVRNHGASGMCCLLRERERDKATELEKENAALRELVEESHSGIDDHWITTDAGNRWLAKRDAILNGGAK